MAKVSPHKRRSNRYRASELPFTEAAAGDRREKTTKLAKQSGGALMKVKPIAQPIICVAVIENDPIRLVGLRSILDAVSGFHLTTVSDIATVQGVDVVILRNSGLKHLEAIATLRIVRPDLRVLVTGTGSDDESILRIMTSGAKGYVDEAAPISELVQAVVAVHQGSVWIPRRVMSMFIERSGGLLSRNSRGHSSNFTAREKQVLEMLVEGRSNKEIGNPLGIEERTVKAHVAKLMRKVGVKNRIALCVHAIHHSLVSVQ
jgi:DNA-binding NarL/FixJ family response regulator